MSEIVDDTQPSFESPVVARTRLVPPCVRAETVLRSELVAHRLSSPARLAVVSGHAGSGKSTLLAQCYAADPFPAWLSLGASDNDPISLWWSLIAAVRTVIGEFGETYRHRLLAGGPVVLDEVIDSVCNELMDRATPIHLFLDDLHRVDSEVCRRSIHRFVRSIPGGVRVTIASRNSAPIPLAQMRVEGELVEIGGAELALSTEQAHQFLSLLGVELTPTHLSLLVERTEGWPAGIQLAGMAMARAADSATFVPEFHGTDRTVADYLIGEVLDSMSDAERDFLVRTSVLGRLSGGLCDAVTGRADGAELLTRLGQSNAFVIALDRDGLWYRYHHMFAEMLETELRRTHADDIHDLHRRASEWLRDDGQVTAAITHSMAAGDTEPAADLVCGHWLDLMNHGRLETVRLLLAQFRTADLEGHQPLSITAALAHGMAGERREAQHCLRIAERTACDRTPPDGTATMESSLALARGSMALDGVDAALADGRTAYELEPVNGLWHPLAALIVGLALVMRGDSDESVPFFEEVAATDRPTVRAYAFAELSLAQLRRGEPGPAAATAALAVELVDEAGIQDLVMAATAQAAYALAALALGDDRTARVALRAAGRPMRTLGLAMPMDSTHARLLLARVAIALGESDIARQYLDDAQRVADEVDDIGAMREEMVRLRSQLPPLDAAASTAHGDSDFTDRELEVIHLLPTSLTTREIGDELYLSRNTIKTYLRRTRSAESTRWSRCSYRTSTFINQCRLT